MQGERGKNLVMIMQDDLSAEKNVNKIVGATYNLLTNMRVAFDYMDEDMLRERIVSIIRPGLEYAAVVWSPHLRKHIEKLETIQRFK